MFRIFNRKQKEKSMLDTLKSLWPQAESLTRMSSVLSSIVDLVSHFEADKLKDGNTRDAAIDAVIQLLQSEKSTPAS